MNRPGLREETSHGTSHGSSSVSHGSDSSNRRVESLSRRSLLRTAALFGISSVGVTASRAQSSGDDGGSEGGAVFAVSDLTPSAPTVIRGEQFEVSATVENLGTAGGQQVVEFRIDDETVRSTEVALDAGQQRTVSYQVSAPDQPDVYEHGFHTDDHSYTGQLTVTYDHSNSELSVADFSPQELTIERGEPITVTATITNAFDEETTEEVTYTLYGEVVASPSVTLDGGERTTIEFEVTDTSGYEGKSSHAVQTAHDTASGPVTASSGDGTGETDADNSSSDGFGPGLGIGGAVTALGGASYLLKRDRTGDH